MQKILLITGLALLCLHAAAGDFNILDYGAAKDTSRLSTGAINKAIAACHQAGGGRVVIPAGQFISGTIFMKSNVTLYLESGAVLYAGTSHGDFPKLPQPAYLSQKDKGGWFALIYAEGVSNIAIRGSGTINGNGKRQLPRPELFGGDLDGRPRNILFISCKDVTVEGITMTAAGIWNQHYLDCEDVLVNQVRVYNHANRNNDGIDIDGCRRFILSNSIIDSDDDAICLKSTGPAPCENVVITGCIASSHTNAIKCGTESTGGFKNINISNCIVKPSRNTEKPIFNTPHGGYTGVSLEIVDGGVMDGVNVNNIVIEGTECPIYVRLGNRARKYNDAAPTPAAGQMRNIQISHITAYRTGNYSSSVTGVTGALIENIVLSHIRVVNKGGLQPGDYIGDAAKVKEAVTGYPEPKVWGSLPCYSLFIRHVKNITVCDVSFTSVNEDPRKAIIADDVHYLEVRNMQTNQGLFKTENSQLIAVRTYRLDSTVVIR